MVGIATNTDIKQHLRLLVNRMLGTYMMLHCSRVTVFMAGCLSRPEGEILRTLTTTTAAVLLRTYRPGLNGGAGPADASSPRLF